MKNILVVDDEKKICEFIKAFLENEGFNIDVCFHGKDAIDKFNNKIYDLIILDRMMPDISGEELCMKIRSKSDVPIIMLTAKSEMQDKLDGFEVGCDDYICKPFNITELLYRVKVILKRSNKEKYNDKNIIKYGEKFLLDIESHELKIKGNIIPLTNTEYKILYLLSTNPNKIFTREEILEAAVGEYLDKADRAIDNHIKNLRQKIDLNDGDIKIIQTIYGVGYKFGLQK